MKANSCQHGENTLLAGGGMAECAYGEHTKRDPDYAVETGDQEEAGEAGQGFGAQLELSYF
jgi:hypothetical protein